MADKNQITQEKKVNPNPIYKVQRGIYVWFNKLLGKQVKKEEVVQPVTQKKAEVVQEDSIKEDIKNARVFLKEKFVKFSIEARPVLEKGKETSDIALKKTKEVVDISFTRKLVRILMIIIGISVAIFVVIRLFYAAKSNVENQNGGNPAVNPTIPPYTPTNPSLYADDKELLKIEEDMRVLLSEISGKKLEDDSIKPPDLDMDVNFK